jgi:hypothetical protein
MIAESFNKRFLQLVSSTFMVIFSDSIKKPRIDKVITFIEN